MPKDSPYLYLLEPLLEHPSFVEARMFGCQALYVHGRMMAVLPIEAEGDWQGALFPCSREHHGSLIEELPPLEPHPVLGKWLWIREESDAFEPTVMAMVRLILSGDPRLGIFPEPDKKRRSGGKRRPGKRRSGE